MWKVLDTEIKQVIAHSSQAKFAGGLMGTNAWNTFVLRVELPPAPTPPSPNPPSPTPPPIPSPVYQNRRRGGVVQASNHMTKLHSIQRYAWNTFVLRIELPESQRNPWIRVSPPSKKFDFVHQTIHSRAGHETNIYNELAYSKSFNGDRKCCREEEDLAVSWEE